MYATTPNHSNLLIVFQARAHFEQFSRIQILPKNFLPPAKRAKIITGVLAPFSVQKMLESLGTQPFSIALDASNHGAVKLFPLVIRYFTKMDGIQVRLLDLESLPCENSTEVHSWIIKILKRHNLSFANLIAFCADNTAANFGSAERRGQNNVFYHLKQQRNELIGVGCVAHVLHNAAKRAADGLRMNGTPIDLEAVVFKLAGHFKNSTNRTEEFKAFCEELDVEFEVLNRHGPTRWTTLQKVIGKIIRLFYALTPFFANEDDVPAILHDFFYKFSDQSLVVCHFLHHVLEIFNKSIDNLQKEKSILSDLLKEMQVFESKISERQQKNFYGTETHNALQKLDEREREKFRKEFQFYQSVLSYIKKWFRRDQFPEKLDWVSLELAEISHEDVLSLASQIAPQLTNLFDEVSEANQILKAIPFQQFATLSTEEKWKNIFAADLPELYRLVSMVLSIPVSNAFVERVFSLCGSQWTDVRNLLKVETIKALAQTKINFDYTG